MSRHGVGVPSGGMHGEPGDGGLVRATSSVQDFVIIFCFIFMSRSASS